MQGADTYFTYATPHGALTITTSEKGVSGLSFGEAHSNAECQATALSNRAATQVQEYLAGKRTSFDLPLDLRGSSFQQAVWNEIMRIPYGTTCTAADIARAIGKPGAYRSVGMAVKKNPVPILVPTHRIEQTCATGRLARIDHALLSLERSVIERENA